jgi:hypothetical protein
MNADKRRIRRDKSKTLISKYETNIKKRNSKYKGQTGNRYFMFLLTADIPGISIDLNN